VPNLAMRKVQLVKGLEGVSESERGSGAGLGATATASSLMTAAPTPLNPGTPHPGSPQSACWQCESGGAVLLLYT